MTDRPLLRRTRWYTILGGLLTGGVVALLLTPRDGLGILVGSIWAAMNLRVMEGLLSAALLPRDHPRDLRRVFLWSILKLGVYVLAVWLLVVAPFPVVGLAIGLTVMLAALVLAGLTTRSEADQEAPLRGDDDPA
jgi:uncharacterized membrane protein YbhN (UPF0104 family)